MKSNAMAHPGRLLKRELTARDLSANRLALDIGVPWGRITDILNGRRSITADTAVRLGRYFGNRAQFWLDLQSRYDIAVIERERGAEIARRVRPADVAWRTCRVGFETRSPRGRFTKRHFNVLAAWATAKRRCPPYACSNTTTEFPCSTSFA